MALVSKVRTYSICLSSGSSALASLTAGGSLPDSLPSGSMYCRYSISNLAAMVIASGSYGMGAGPDRACPRVRSGNPDGGPGPAIGRHWLGVAGRVAPRQSADDTRCGENVRCALRQMAAGGAYGRT